MKVIHCATEQSDYMEVMTTLDEDCQRVLNIELVTIEDPDSSYPSVNLNVDTAKELIKELQEFVSNEEVN